MIDDLCGKYAAWGEILCFRAYDRKGKKIMTEILAVFRSRTQAIDCKTRLVSCGIPAAVVATPSELKLGCGFSVKIPASAQKAAKYQISRAGYSAFYGYMSYPPVGGRRNISR